MPLMCSFTAMTEEFIKEFMFNFTHKTQKLKRKGAGCGSNGAKNSPDDATAKRNFLFFPFESRGKTSKKNFLVISTAFCA
jgi:hypothetical protein